MKINCTYCYKCLLSFYLLDFNCSNRNEPVTVSIGEAVEQAKRALDENSPDYLQGYLALTDTILDHIMNAKCGNDMPSRDHEKLKEVRK